MLNYQGLIEQLIKIFLYVCIGFIAAKGGVIKGEGRNFLSRLIVSVCIPALLLSPAVSSEIVLTNAEIGLTLFVAFLWQLAMLGIGMLAAKLFCRERKERDVFAVMMGFGNVGIFGFPVIYPLYGELGLQFAALANCSFNLVLYSVGQQMTTGEKTAWGKLLRLLINPASIAAVSVPFLFLLRLPCPKVLTETVSSIGNMTLPLLMFTVGSNLAEYSFSELIRQPKVFAAIGVRLLLIPLILLLPLRLLVPGEAMHNTLILLSGMPSAGIAASFCIIYQNHAREASTIVFVSTIFSLLSIPLVALLL